VANRLFRRENGTVPLAPPQGTVPIFAAAIVQPRRKALFAAKMGLSPWRLYTNIAAE